LLRGKISEITSTQLEVFPGKRTAFQEENTKHLSTQIVSSM
jgi:hypothetical protein